MFEKAGLDRETPPKTWEEMEQFSRQIIESGAAPCGFTTAWISWIHTENLSTYHNQPIGTEQKTDEVMAGAGHDTASWLRERAQSGSSRQRRGQREILTRVICARGVGTR